MAKTTVQFSEGAAEQLEELSHLLSTSKADVLRNALSLYAFLVDELGERGKELGILERETVKKVVVVPGLRQTKSASAPVSKPVLA
jgi:hypothetical protein